MELKFELTKEDYINFNIYHTNNSKVVRKKIFKQRYVYSLAYLIVPFVLLKVFHTPLWCGLVGFIVSYLYWIIFHSIYIKKKIKKNINKVVNEGKFSTFIGNKTVIISGDGIKQIGDLGEQSIKWAGIEKILENDDYIYIYTSDISAYIIPKRVLESSTESLEFLSLIKGYSDKYRQ